MLDIKNIQLSIKEGDNKKISIKQVAQQQPVLTFAYTINEIEFDKIYK